MQFLAVWNPRKNPKRQDYYSIDNTCRLHLFFLKVCYHTVSSMAQNKKQGANNHRILQLRQEAPTDCGMYKLPPNFGLCQPERVEGSRIWAIMEEQDTNHLQLRQAVRTNFDSRGVYKLPPNFGFCQPERVAGKRSWALMDDDLGEWFAC